MKFINKILIINSLIGCLSADAIEEYDSKGYSLKKLNASRENAWITPVYEKDERTVSLVQALIQSERDFWKTNREEFLATNKRLQAIVTILDKAENRLNLELQFQLFNSARSEPADYERYTAYKNLVKVDEILGHLEVAVTEGWASSYSLEQTLISLVAKAKEEEKKHQSRRKIFTHSAVPSVNKKLKEIRSEIQEYKNFDVITSGFAGLLIKILQDHVRAIKLKNIPSKKYPPRVISSKKSQSKAKSPSYKIASQPQEISAQDINALTAEASQWEGGENAASDLLDLIIEPASTAFLEDYSFATNHSEKNSLFLANEEKEGISKEGTEENQNKEDSNVRDKEETTFEGEKEVEYDLQPWKKYQAQSSESSLFNSSKAVKGLQLALPLALEDEHWMTIKNLLKLNPYTSRERVAMKDFINVVSQMKGSVIRGSKNVHFAIPNIFSGKMVAVSMHALHGDKAALLPKNTYYWERAAALLEKAGFSEYLQQAK